MYWLLFVILIGLTVGIFFLFKKDILSPSFIFAAMCTVSILAAIVARGFWNDVSSIDALVFWIPTVSVIATAGGEYLCRYLYFRNSTHSTNNEKEKAESIHSKKILFPKPVIAFIYLFMIVTLGFLIKEMSDITGIGDNIALMINKYRTMTPLFNASDSSTSVSTLLVQMIRISDLFGMFALFVLINNLFQKDRKDGIMWYVGIVLFASIIMLFVNGRTSLIQYGFFAFGASILLYRKTKVKNKLKKKARKMFLALAMGGFASVIAVFYLVMPFIGRMQNVGPISYITFYLGDPIPALQKLIDENGLKTSSYFGEESLVGIRGILQKFGLDVDYNVYQDTWVHFGVPGGAGQALSANTFTGMKAYYADWGMGGVVVCQFLFGAVFTFLYLTAARRESFFIYIVFGMFLMNIAGQVSLEKFLTRISIATIIYLVYALVLSKLLFKDYAPLKRLKETYDKK